MDAFLNTKIEFLKGVGPLRAEWLNKELVIFTYKDLLEYFPFRHVDKSKMDTISCLNFQSAFVQLDGIIKSVKEVDTGNVRRLVAHFTDGTGTIELVWFKGISWVLKTLKLNSNVIIYGKVSFFLNQFQISHPEIEDKNIFVNKAIKFNPIYYTTEKLKAKGISSKTIVNLVFNLINMLKPVYVAENIPQYILDAEHFLDRFNAIKNMHFPESLMQFEQARHRIAFEEFFITQINLSKVRMSRIKYQQGNLFETLGQNFNFFYGHLLPFELTNAQKKVLKEIRKDTLSGRQMNRLIQGDVGSGKTIVALICMLIATDNSFQSCMMAPTEILAKQHFESIVELTKLLNLKIGFLTSSVKGKNRKLLLSQIENQEIDILVGTHSVIEDTVVFKNLGFVVIDEQHKFGVEQRATMWKKNIIPPHILVMTATPIPRTLAMALYGDLEVSVINELPPGRKHIDTVHRNALHRTLIIDFVKKNIAEGRQVYIVFPLIEESEKMDYENLMNGVEMYKSFFPEPKFFISVVHGRQSTKEKQSNMNRFKEGDTNIMLSTTVIEVGVNVPNANIMIIESAERFGLSQLHQLRGRVGRGSEKSYCILLTNQKLSNEAKQRLDVMCQTNDGFIIAEKDLEIRGPGEIHGIKQSGLLNFKVANIVNDKALLEKAKNYANDIMNEDINLMKEEHKELKNFLLNNNKQQSQWAKIS